MSLVLATVLACALGGPAPPAVTLHGRVVDARSSGPVAAATVRVSAGRRETVSGPDGRFAIAGLHPGGLQLRVNAPGYREFVARMALGEAPAEFLVSLEPEPPRVSEALTITADRAAAPSSAPPPFAREHDADLVRAVSSVVASDPLRAVQALPGVAANDEFDAGFAARGAGFAAAGLYIDGVRLSAPFHTVRDVNDGYTLTIFNTDVLDSVSLLPGGSPARYGDRVGAVLAVRTREGRSDSFHGRFSLGAAGAFATLEGPLGTKKASWLVSARKSYLDYIIERVDDSPQLALGYSDLTARATAHPSPKHTVSLLGLLGRARYRNTEKAPDAHEMKTAEAGTGLVHLSWRGLPSAALSIGTTAFALHETGDNRDSDGFRRFASDSWSSGALAEVAWRRGAWRVEGGLEARQLHDDVLSQRYETRTQAARVSDDYDQRGWLSGGFAQAAWAGREGRVVATAGGRLDHLSATGETLVLPRASLELGLTPSTRALAAFGGYAQFPGFDRLAGEHGNPELDAERSRHLVFALEQRLPLALRLRLEAYQQRESGLIWNRELEYRIEGGRLLRPDPRSVLFNVLAGPSRGLEATLATAGTGPISGFLSYTWAHATREDPSGLRFDSDFDQRHTVTAFVRTRPHKGLVLAAAFRHGSGFPLPGFLEQRPDGVYVAAERNRYGPPAYARLDLRAERRFTWARAALELYLEIGNALDRDNERYTEITSVDVRTGRANIDGDKLLPLVPLFGATVEF